MEIEYKLESLCVGASYGNNLSLDKLWELLEIKRFINIAFLKLSTFLYFIQVTQNILTELLVHLINHCIVHLKYPIVEKKIFN